MQHVIQLLAALANGRARTRFAQVALAGEAGTPADAAADRLLRAAGVLEDLPGGAVKVDEAALAALLGEARAAVPSRPAGKVDLLPRQRALRIQVLRELALRSSARTSASPNASSMPASASAPSTSPGCAVPWWTRGSWPGRPTAVRTGGPAKADPDRGTPPSGHGQTPRRQGGRFSASSGR
ncbi:hypothetical protein ACVWWH_003729 [Sinomonas sp. RB5]